MVVAAIEIIIIEVIEIIFLAIVQFLVGLLVLYGDTWVPAVIALMVNQEQTLAEGDTIGCNLVFAHA